MIEALNLTRSIRAGTGQHLASVRRVDEETVSVERIASCGLRLNRTVLLQIAVCVIPAMVCLAVGSPEVGGKLFFLLLILMLAREWLRRDRLVAVSLIVGTIPALMIFRDFFFFSSVIFILGSGLTLWYLESISDFSRLWNDPRFKTLFLLSLFYWLLSFLLTGQYSSNLRIMELTLTVASVYLLAGHLECLATALTGVGVSILSMGLAFLPYGDRLGKGDVGDYDLGNPVSFGIPLAVIFTLAIADRGKWLLLEKHLYWRIALALAAGAFLILSTSRVSWLVVLVNMFTLFFIDRRQRRLLLALAGLMSLAVVLLLATSRGESVERFYDKTFSSETTLESSTSGRSDQWELFPTVFADSPLWGFGPGSGATVYAQYSIGHYLFHGGDRLAWHSLYLQVGVETGIIGLIALAFLLMPLPWQGWRTLRLSGNAVPLLSVLSFLIIVASVSGMDAATGIFLGLGLLHVRRADAPEFLLHPKSKGYILQPLTKDQVQSSILELQFLDSFIPNDPWGRKDWLMDLPEKWQVSWVLLKERVPVGFLIASRKGDALHIHRIAIEGGKHRKGFGKLLLGTIALCALERRCPTLTTKVLATNNPARAFFQRFGFTVVGRERDNILMNAESRHVFDLTK